MERALEFIKNYDRIAVFTHLNPDGDALGSAFSLTVSLRAFCKQADTILVENPPTKYRFEEFDSLYRFCADTDMADYDACISVDCADAPRLGKAKDLFFKKPTLNLDHHISNSNFADVNYVVDAPAAGEIVYDVVKALGIPIGPVAALGIYVAISTDTGNFTFSNTTAKTIEICSELVTNGLDISYAANRVFNTRSLGATRLIARFIDNIQLFYDGKLAISTITQKDMEETGTVTGDNEVLIDYARSIDTVQLAVFVRELKQDTYKVSLRSKERIDVSAFAARYGGGGHVRAAGLMMKGNLFDVIDRIVKEAGEVIL